MSTPTLPAPADLGGIPLGAPEPVEAPPASDTKPARPTTREGRRQAAAAKRAAKGAAGQVKRDTAPAKPKPTKSDVQTSVESLHTMVGGALPFLGMPATGQALAATGKDAGLVWADAVRRYPQLERLFGAGTDGLIVFRLLMVYAPLVSLAITERSTPKPEGAGPDLGVALGGLMGMMAGGAPVEPDAFYPQADGMGTAPGQNTGGRP
jgi:hypothetical protein